MELQDFIDTDEMNEIVKIESKKQDKPIINTKCYTSTAGYAAKLVYHLVEKGSIPNERIKVDHTEIEVLRWLIDNGLMITERSRLF